MSLYYEAASVLLSDSQGGSLKSRIYNNTSKFKSKPAHIYALISEASKYDSFHKEVIEHVGILALEPKLTPLLCLLLVHDHCFSKGGIAAPVNHPLRQAVERHKARIQAELTKSRLRRHCANVDELKKVLQTQKPQGTTIPQPRWVRVNRIKSSVAEQLQTTFAGYTSTSALTEVTASPVGNKVLYIDGHIPDLIAIPAGAELIKTTAYKNGEIILQDKASCMPAHLLLGSEVGGPHLVGDIIDACAAPGNKTTHLASIVSSQKSAKSSSKSRIFACERDPARSRTLQKMIDVAGASKIVTVLPEQDFLALDPTDERFANVTHLLLDPSCSGSGIVGREDVPVLALPEKKHTTSSSQNQNPMKKRKWEEKAEEKTKGSEELTERFQHSHVEEETFRPADAGRLEKLSNLQTRIIEHAFSFPAARSITYSTCSIHTVENESVTTRAVYSPVGKERGWHVLRREKQVEGLRKWQRRGVPVDDLAARAASLETPLDAGELEGCIRCVAGSDDGTMGFFVCIFVREQESPQDQNGSMANSHDEQSEDEWEGFSGSE